MSLLLAAGGAPATGPVPRYVGPSWHVSNHADLGRAAGFALFFAAALGSSGQSVTSRATFGSHAVTLYNAEAAKTVLFPSARPPPTTATVSAYVPVGQQPYSDIAPLVWASVKVGSVPNPLPRVSAAPQRVDPAQQPSIWQSARTAIVAQSAPLAFRFNPQQSYWDAPSGVWPSTVSTGWISTSISAGPDPSEFRQPKAIFSAPIGIPVVITGPTVTPNPFVPGQVDLNLKPLFFPAATAPITGSAISSMATYGLHAAALYNAEAAKTQFFPIAGGGTVVPPVTRHGGGSGRDRRQRKELRKPVTIPATIYPVQAPDATLYEVPAPNITAILTAKQAATLAVKTAEETSVKAAQQFSVEAKDLVSKLTVLAKQKQQATLQAEADDQLAAETEAFQAMMILMLIEDE